MADDEKPTTSARARLEARSQRAIEPWTFKDDKKLLRRIRLIIKCSVCGEVPATPVYQCSRGDLLCSNCYNHVTMVASILDRPGYCPTCRVEQPMDAFARNLIVEKALAEMTWVCEQCDHKIRCTDLEKHECTECPKRPVLCKFNRIGCPWEGGWDSRDDHELGCRYANKTGTEILAILQSQNEGTLCHKNNLNRLFDLFALDNILAIDLDLRPTKHDVAGKNVLFKSDKFVAFGMFCSLKMLFQQFDIPSESNRHDIMFQLLLEEYAYKEIKQVALNFMIKESKDAKYKLETRMFRNVYKNDSCSSEYLAIEVDNMGQFTSSIKSGNVPLRIYLFLEDPEPR